ncbi:major facilitator superfamily domain-containing protein [Xylaria venustula]|nr:major facilitator superfamily domain-containing protein [Xylaria venustula]
MLHQPGLSNSSAPQSTESRRNRAVRQAHMSPSTTPEDGQLATAEKQAIDTRDQSPEISSNGNDIEKAEFPEDDGGAAEEEKTVPAPAAAPPMEYPSGIEVLFIMTALVLSISLIALDQTIVATAIPKITDEFKRVQDVSWYGSAYFLTLGAFQSLWGKVYKYFPLKTSFLVSIFIFEVGSLISGVARNSVTVIVGRAISGLGASGIAPGVYTISAFSAHPTKRATYTGVIGAAYGVAAVVGPLIGGGLTAVTWRWCFYINLPVGGLSAFVILVTFKTPKAAKMVEATFKEKLLHMDFLGTALVMGASIALILALEYAGVSYAWNSSVVIGLLVGFVAIVIALVVAEIWQGERAMLTPRIVRKRTVWVNAVWGFFFAGSYFATLYYLPIYFQSIDNVTPVISGVRTIPFIAFFSVATFGSGKVITKTGIAAPYLTVGSVIVTVAAGLLFTLDVGTSTGKWVGYQILAGFGYGLSLQVPVVVAQAFSEPSDIAPTTAIIIFARSVGATFLIAAAESAFANQLLVRLHEIAPNIQPAAIVNLGATQLRDAFSGADLNAVIHAYAWGIKVAFAITIASCGITVPISLLSKWTNVNEAKKK